MVVLYWLEEILPVKLEVTDFQWGKVNIKYLEASKTKP